MIKNKIIKTALIDWHKAKWLQDNLKVATPDNIVRLKNSIKENQFIMPFTVWEENKNNLWILDGHHRKLALEELEKEGIQIPTQLPANFIDENIDKIPELNKNTTSKVGDIWQLGIHKLICGDSSDLNVYKKLLLNEKVDLLFTDPPYDLEIKIMESVLDNLDVYCNKNIFIMCTDSLIKKILEYVKWNFYQLNIFEIPSALPAGHYFYRKHIPIIHFYKSKVEWINNKKGYTSLIKGQYRGSLEESNVHKHAKPVSLPKQFIESFKCDNVMDVFGGYGSTLIASALLEKPSYTIELSPHYCDAIIERYENLFNKKTKRIKT